MSPTLLGVIAAAVVVIAITQVAVAVLAVRTALQALALARRLEAEVGPVLAQVRNLSADAARSAALLASQAERVDRLASRMTRRIDEFAASPVREGLAVVLTIVEAVIGHRYADPAVPRGRRSPPDPGDAAPV